MPKETISILPVNKQCALAIKEMTNKLWGGLLTQNTWNFRQAIAYGAPLSGEENTDYKKQDLFIGSIVEELEPQISYIGKAYHFIDNLSAQAASMTFDGEQLVEFLGEIGGKIEKLGIEFTQFLAEDSKDAFEIKFDLTDEDNPKYSILDFDLDTETLQSQWDDFSTQIQSILEPKNNS